MLRLILVVLPLGLDTFAVSVALGIRGLPERERLRVSLVLCGFEMATPVVGLLLGRALGQLVGSAATDVAIAVLAVVGLWMLLHEEAGDERERIGQLASGRGLALLALGISISLDELAVGLTIGLLHLVLWLAVLLIGLEAFVAGQLGLRLGARLNERVREGAETLAGIALLGLAGLLAAEQLA